MYDVWREHYGNMKDFTFFSARHGSYSRIDMIFATRVIADQMENIVIGKRFYSDHAVVSAVWNLYSKMERLRLWRLDNNLLTVQGIKEQIQTETASFFQLNNGSEDVLSV